MTRTVFKRSEALLDIGKSGKWKGTNFNHIIDESFGNTLIALLKENKISSMTDLGCGTGGYINMITEAGIAAMVTSIYSGEPPLGPITYNLTVQKLATLSGSWNLQKEKK